MSVVIDASALLAWLHNEPGSDVVEEQLDQSIISAINWSEVVQKALSKDIEVDGMKEDIEALGVKIEAVNVSTAELASYIWLENKKLGLSIADRICLALAQEKKLTVLTADKEWTKVITDIKVQLIR
ncbi:MAG: type II toxin-antitoxin system VapC family toxin [Pseudomonadota bacterium]